MIILIKAIVKKIKRELSIAFQPRISEQEIAKVRDFFCIHDDFRNVTSCSVITGISQDRCLKIKRYLYKNRLLGLYAFEEGQPPQKFMKKYILEKFPLLTNKSYIIEVGPGEYPLFNCNEYPNWIGADRFFDGKQINFKHLEWASNKYPPGKIIKGGYENLSQVVGVSDSVQQADLVVGSHSYEHTLLPIDSLREINKVLKPGGIVVLFVPDGFSDDPNTKDPTHTIYLNKGMVKEFFDCAGGFTSVTVENFRPNADLVITAIKK